MRRLALLLLIVPAGAQAAPPPVNNPDIVVTGENRMICRRVTRTATRMRVGRVCRTQAQWAADPGPGASDDPNATIDGAADTLEVLGHRMNGVRADTGLGPR